MLCVLPFHAGDKPQAISLAGWLREMGELSDHKCLLCVAADCDESGVIEPLRDCFGAVSVFRPNAKVKRGDGPMGYARAANAMWQSVAWKIYFQDKCPWLWLEPDACPTRPSWLREIEQQYIDMVRLKKVFMGAMGQAQIAMLNGVAVYPAAVCDYAPLALQAGDCPWDLNAAPQILKYAHVSDLFQHVYQVKGESPTFPKHQDKLNGAALFHRCKDGTLITFLKENGYTKVGDATCGAMKPSKDSEVEKESASKAAATVQPAVAADDSELMGESVDYAQRLEEHQRRNAVRPEVPNEGDRLGELVWRGGKWHTAEPIVPAAKAERSAVMEKYKHPEKDLSVVPNPDDEPRRGNTDDGSKAVKGGAQTPSRDALVKEAVAVLKQLCSSPRATSMVRKELKKQKVITK